MIGTTIGHFTIDSKLGEGGMGVVYKAHDTKLNRTVALKLLPDRVQKDSSAKARFIQEAQAAAGLNHPNICVIHGVEEHDDFSFIIMEYVEGGELAGKLPFTRSDEAVRIAMQIGEALQAAHEKGIVHRDIKADNIMLTAKGQAKVMDFGLAKLKGALKLTRTSSTVGTLGYMSPEQIQGEEADSRSDIFSFGVLLFEMLTGKMPFRGEHEAAMVYSIVNELPQDITAIKPDLSPLVVSLIHRCLEKDPEDRYQTMQDIVSELRRSLKKGSNAARKASSTVSLQGGVVSAATPINEHRSKRSPLLIPLIAAIVALVALSAVLVIVMSKGVTTEGFVGPNTRIYRFTSMPGLEDKPTWSPDGKFLAYVSDERGQTDIIIQPADGGSPVRVFDSPANEVQPAWSPDGSRIAFVSSRNHGGHFAPVLGFGNLNLILDGKGGDIFVSRAFGGEPLMLTPDAFDPAWSPDGKEIVFRSARNGQWDLWRISADGGEPTRLTDDPQYDYQPVWSPDGQWVVYGCVDVGVASELRAVRLSGGSPLTLTHWGEQMIGPEFADKGTSILFSTTRGGTINVWEMPFAPGDTSLTAHRVTIGQGSDVNASLSRDGRKLAFSSISSGPDVWELTVATGGLRRVTSENGIEQQARISPDGSHLAVVSDRGGAFATWLVSPNGTFKRLFAQSTSLPAWSPNGKFIAANTVSTVEVRSVDDLSPTTVIPDALFASWDPSGTKIAFRRTEKGQFGVWVRDLASGKDELIASMDGNPLSPAWSPDGKVIAFNVDAGDKRQLLVVPATGGTPRVVVTDDAEYSHPSFSRTNSDRVVCVRDHLDIVEVSLLTGKVTYLKKFEDPAIRLTDYPSWSSDGKKIYFDQIRRSGDIFVMENRR